MYNLTPELEIRLAGINEQWRWLKVMPDSKAKRDAIILNKEEWGEIDELIGDDEPYVESQQSQPRTNKKPTLDNILSKLPTNVQNEIREIIMKGGGNL